MTAIAPAESSRVSSPLLVAAALALVTSFALFTYKQVPLLTFPYAINYGEGVLLDQMRRVTEAPGLYPEFEQPPYVIDNYPPIYPLVARLFPAPPHAPFFGGRLVSLLATLISTWMVGLLVRRWAGDAAGLFASATFLALPEIHRFAGLARVDALALACGLVGLYCILRQSSWLKVAGCAAFFVSIYTRQSMLALPTVGFLLLLRRDGLSAWVWPAGLLVAGVAGYTALHLTTDGRVYDHLVHFNVLQYNWDAVTHRWFGLLYPLRYPLVVAALLALAPLPRHGRWRLGGSLGIYGVVLLWAAWWLLPVLVQSSIRYFFPAAGEVGSFGIHEQDLHLYGNLREFHLAMAAAAVLATLRGWFYSEKDEDDPTLGIFVLAGFASAALIGRVGSDVNYLFELCALLCLTVGRGLGRGPQIQRRVIAVLLAIGLLGNMTLLMWPGPYGDTSASRLDSIAKRTQRMLSILRQIEGPILSEDPQLQPLLGKPLEFEVFMHSRLIEAGAWDPRDLERSLEERRWGAIVLRWGLASPDPATATGVPTLIPVREAVFLPKSFIDEHILPYYRVEPRYHSFEAVTRAYGVRWDILVPRD
ncbi:MAG: ArnT family glycosyltransferase [Planctomycetota bacterium]